MKVLVFIEQRDGVVKTSSKEALTAARQLTGNSADVAGVLVGSADTSSLKGFGADKIYTVTGDAFSGYNPISYSAAIEKAVTAFGANAVLGIASPMGRDIFPRLSAALNAALLTDIVSLTHESGNLTGGVKPMYAGKVLATMSYDTDGLKLMTIRPNTVAVETTSGDAAAESLSVEAPATSLKLVEIKKGASEKADLTEAGRIISGGRSLGSKENFAILDDCANVLGATVGASRAAVDSGYASHDMQVGQTGKTVNPQLYIACGISGSIQHMAGMRTSKTIVAINTDPEAPIFTVADYGIVADLFEAVPELTKKLKEIL